jgi:hypothetical protein
MEPPKYEPLKYFGPTGTDRLSQGICNKAEADRFKTDLQMIAKHVFTLEDMENAYNAGVQAAAQSIINAGQIREPFLVRFIDWIKTYKTK